MNGGDVRFLCEIENKSQEVQRIIKNKQILVMMIKGDTFRMMYRVFWLLITLFLLVEKNNFCFFDKLLLAYFHFQRLIYL